MKVLTSKARTSVAVLLMGLSSAAGLMFNVSPVRADDYDHPQFNATIYDPPTNCRATPDGRIVRVFGRGVVSLDPHPVPAPDGNWYYELYNDCYIHESQFHWGT